MSDIQPLKEDVVHAGTIEDPIPQKLIFVKKDSTGAKKVYTLGMGGTTGGSDVNVSNASDTVVGIVKLTDDATLDAPAATGYTALTPNGAKVAIETAKSEITQGIRDTVDEAIQDKIDSGEIGSGGSLGYVVTPTITTPVHNATNVSTLLTIMATPYKNVFGTEDPRAHRVFQVSESTDFADTVLDENVNADSYQVTTQLTPNKTFYVRVKDVASSGYESAWASSVRFTTSAGLVANTPTITLHGYADSPTDILSGVCITASAYDTSGQDEHKATSWSISTKDGTRGVVWQSLNNATNKTEVTVPDGTLSQNTAYVLTVIYHGTKAFDSAPAVVEFTTSDDFGHVVAPTLSVEGGPNAVYETPLLTGGAFSNTRDSDTHDMTDWEVLLSDGYSSVWSSTNDTTNKTQIRVPAAQLAVGTAYKARVRYHGVKYGWSQYTVVDFSTVAAFNVVNTPTIMVQGAPDKILETPMLISSAFGGTNVTHKSTDWEILLASNNSEVWSSKEDTTNLTSIKVPKGILQISTGYIFKVRYNANEEVSSEYASATYTTATSFIRYNYIGIPGTKTFGIGLTTEDIYTSVGLINASNNTDEDDFHYGQYCSGKYESGDQQNSVDMKWTPKFYIAMLQKNQGTENLSDSELDALLPYVEVTKEQMKEAQRRSPHNAMVVAPSDMFTNEADANSHGFYLMRGFIDGGKEQEGFFISNYCASYASSTARVLKLGVNTRNTFYIPVRANSNLTGLVGTMFNASKATNAKGNFISTLEGTYYQCCSIFAWAVISVISLIQGQYATDTAQCTWYDKNLITNYPKGINSNHTQDIDDPTVTSSTFDSSYGTFSVENPSKTTHNGYNNGTHMVNGWLWQYVIGSFGDGSKLLKRSASIYDITYDNVDNPSASFWEAHNTSNISTNWGGTKSSFPDLTSTDKDLFGIYPFGGNTANNSLEFGTDLSYRSSGAGVSVGGSYNDAIYAGIFRRSDSHWTSSSADYGFRGMAYPRRAGIDYEEGTWTPPTTRILLTANGGGGTPESQSVVVDSGTTFGDAAAKLTQPTKTGHTFKGWA